VQHFVAVVRGDGWAAALSLQRPGNTEAARRRADTVVRGPDDPVCRLQDIWTVTSGTATDDPLAGRCFSRTPLIRWCTLVIFVEAILDPLPDVAGHVVQAPGVGLEGASGRGLLDVPLTAATFAVGVALADIVAPKYFVVAVARAAYSHSASVSRR
jgi:hypothetical protein